SCPPGGRDGGAAWGLQLATSMARIPGPPITPDQIAARDAAQREESEHVIADYAARQRERQEREAKQAREVFEQQIAEWVVTLQSNMQAWLHVRSWQKQTRGSSTGRRVLTQLRHVARKDNAAQQRVADARQQSVGLDARELYHLAPLFGLVRNNLAEVGRRHR